MHWIILVVSCAAIFAGMEINEVALAVFGLAGMIIGLWIGPSGER
jgi:hypothetical protein